MNKMSNKLSKSTLNMLTFLGVFNLLISLVIIFILVFGASIGFRVSQPIAMAIDTPIPGDTKAPVPTRTVTPVPLQHATSTTTSIPTEKAIIIEEAEVAPGEPIYIKYEFGNNIVRLPDGSEIILGLDSEIELTKIFGHTQGATDHEIILLKGTILVVSNLPEGKWFRVLNPNGHIAQVTGSVMVVGYNPETGIFITACVDGDCELGSDAQALFKVAAEEEGWLDENGNFQEPVEVDMDELRAIYGDKIPEEVPDLEAEATAACGEFQSQFPGTPCPEE